MKSLLVCQLCGRWVLRVLRVYIILFIFHQILTLPAYTALEGRFTLGPVSEISKARVEYERYCKKNKSEPLSLEEIDPAFAKTMALTTSSKYAELRERYPRMILAEKSPRRRSFLPFPIGMWSVYCETPVACDDGSRFLESDLESRRVCSFIAEQEGGGFNFAASFIVDALIYVFWISAAFFYARREKRKKRAEEKTLERFKIFRDACFEFYNRTGRFPKVLEDIGSKDDSKFRDAFHCREFQLLSNLKIGVVGATSGRWRAPFSPPGFGSRMLVVMEDGTIVRIQGRRAVNFFNDVVWASKMTKNFGSYCLVDNKLKFNYLEKFVRNAMIAGRVLLAGVLLFPGFYYFLHALSYGFGGSMFFLVAILVLVKWISLILCVVPLYAFGIDADYVMSIYLSIAHTIFGWI